jgi:flagellar biosynthetic protein FlhB
MADSDKESRTEEPTAKRLSEAFQEGSFAKSQDVGIAFGLAAAFVAILFAAPGVAGRTAEISAFVFGHLHRFEISDAAISTLMGQCFGILGSLTFPFVGCAVFAAIASGGLQSGFRLSKKALQVKWSKLNPIQGSTRLLSSSTLVHLGIDLLKLGALIAVLWGAITRILDDPIFYTPVNVLHVGRFISDSTLYVLVRITVACAIIAIISYVYQWRKTRKDLRMTREEVKQERKNAEIDPHVKRAQRALAFRILQRQMLKAVPTADVVVTNPTHYAVALKYERGRDRAPVVIAKGRDVFARRIKDIALRHEVPMVEDKPVARALYRHGSVGKEIPAQLYQAVAGILGFVYRTHRYYFHRLKARRLGAAAG